MALWCRGQKIRWYVHLYSCFQNEVLMAVKHKILYVVIKFNINNWLKRPKINIAQIHVTPCIHGILFIY